MGCSHGFGVSGLGIMGFRGFRVEDPQYLYELYSAKLFKGGSYRGYIGDAYREAV